MAVFLYIAKIAAILESQAWYQPAKTGLFLNISAVGVLFCMELSMAMTSWWMTHALSNRIETTALAIFTSTYSEKNGVGPCVGTGASAGLSLS